MRDGVRPRHLPPAKWTVGDRPPSIVGGLVACRWLLGQRPGNATCRGDACCLERASTASMVSLANARASSCRARTADCWPAPGTRGCFALLSHWPSRATLAARAAFVRLRPGSGRSFHYEDRGKVAREHRGTGRGRRRFLGTASRRSPAAPRQRRMPQLGYTSPLAMLLNSPHLTGWLTVKSPPTSYGEPLGE